MTNEAPTLQGVGNGDCSVSGMSQERVAVLIAWCFRGMVGA